MRRLIIVAIAFGAFSTFGADSIVRADICINHTLKVSHINGRVVALVGNNEEPIPNASIQLKQLVNDAWVTKFTAASDDNGFFLIANAPSGKYEIYVTATHFHAFGTRVTLKVSKSKPTREIIVTLGPRTDDCGTGVVRKINADLVPARRTTRWTGAAGACFASSLVRRRLNEIAPPGQL